MLGISRSKGMPGGLAVQSESCRNKAKGSLYAIFNTMSKPACLRNCSEHQATQKESENKLKKEKCGFVILPCFSKHFILTMLMLCDNISFAYHLMRVGN